MDEPALLIETSGRRGAVGLAVGGTLHERHLDPARRHARDLAPAVAGLLAEVGLTPRDVRRVGVSVGPGSFTGLRVGIMSAKAFAYATGCGLMAVPTFHALAVDVVEAGVEELHAVADGLQGQVYVETFGREHGGWEGRRPLALMPARQWADECRGGADLGQRMGVVGPGLPVVEPLLDPAVRRFDLTAPSLAAMWAVTSRLAPLARDEMLALEPLYLRGSSAEEKAAQRTGERPA